MSVLWLIEDSSRQLADLQTLLTKMHFTVYAFRDTDDLLEQIASVPTPDAIVVDLALKGTSNGFQAATEISKRRPEVTRERFCFISGWKKQFSPIAPPEFAQNYIIDKSNWKLEDLQRAIESAIHSGNAR